jgi:hypothetical protein|tara:strand:+ start:2138 stop:2947 length:810 start_codon:yes stop_codon:yes gene_type:complete
MSIKFEYLEDGTPYVASVLNQRTTVVTDTLNALTREEFALGALRTEHVPTPIGAAGAGPAAEILTRSLSTDARVPPATHTTAGGLLPQPVIDFVTPIDFSDPDQGVNAILVLANIQVIRFLNSEGEKLTVPPSTLGHFAIEDAIQVTFSITVEPVGSGITDDNIEKSNRTISPGLAISELENTTFNFAGAVSHVCTFDTDDDSFKDVAIRTVIRREDLQYDAPINKIKLQVSSVKFFPAALDPGFFLSDGGFIVIGKATLSAIPIQCKV